MNWRAIGSAISGGLGWARPNSVTGRVEAKIEFRGNWEAGLVVLFSTQTWEGGHDQPFSSFGVGRGVIGIFGCSLIR